MFHVHLRWCLKTKTTFHYGKTAFHLSGIWLITVHSLIVPLSTSIFLLPIEIHVEVLGFVTSSAHGVSVSRVKCADVKVRAYRLHEYFCGRARRKSVCEHEMGVGGPGWGVPCVVTATLWWWSHRWQKAAAPGLLDWRPLSWPHHRVAGALGKYCSVGPRCNRACPLHRCTHTMMLISKWKHLKGVVMMTLLRFLFCTGINLW